MNKSRYAAAILAAMCCLSTSPAYAVDGGRYGQVKVVESSGRPRGVVIFFTGRGGFTQHNDAIARELAKAGALVAEVDTAAYIKRLDKSKEKCHHLVGDAEWLSRGLQREHQFPKYFTPILAGIGEGGTLAELTLSQAPAVTIAGAAALDPSATIASLQPMCAEASKAARSGYRYGPPTKLPGYWIVGLTPKVSKADRKYVIALRQDGAHFELHEFGGTTSAADALRELVEPHLTRPARGVGEISSLPLAIMPVPHSSELMAVVLSGDGGWRDLDKTIAENLQQHGVPVVGWDSLRYFWSMKTPDQTANDLAAVIETYMDKWHADKVALIGYSFGADVLPFAYNRLPESLRSHVALIALLGLAKSANFEISVSGWLGAASSPGARPIDPEADKIPAPLLQCFYGQKEIDSLCPTLAKRGVETIRTAGAHHFDGNYVALADRILAGFKRRAGPLPSLTAAGSETIVPSGGSTSEKRGRAPLLVATLVILVALALLILWMASRSHAN
ncbi:MAG: virulence factor family protein [Candidatus Binataceae bacterium]